MWVLLQFISGSIQKNALADFLPVMKLFDLLYPEKEVHICQEIILVLLRSLLPVPRFILLFLAFCTVYLFVGSSSITFIFDFSLAPVYSSSRH